jgi:hypothetical protein
MISYVLDLEELDDVFNGSPMFHFFPDRPSEMEE